MDYNKFIKERMAKNTYARLLGINIEELSYKYCVASLIIEERHLNHFDIVHGGVNFTLGDVAASFAVASLDVKAVTSSAEFHYFSSGKLGDKLIATAKILKAGRKAIITEVTVKNTEDKQLAFGIFTHMLIE